MSVICIPTSTDSRLQSCATAFKPFLHVASLRQARRHGLSLQETKPHSRNLFAMGGLNLEVFKVHNPPTLRHGPCGSSSFFSQLIPEQKFTGTVWHVRHVPHRHHVLFRHKSRQSILRAGFLAQARRVQQIAARQRRTHGRIRAYCRATEIPPGAVTRGSAPAR